MTGKMTVEELFDAILAKSEEMSELLRSPAEPRTSLGSSASFLVTDDDDREVDLFTTSEPAASSSAPSTALVLAADLAVPITTTDGTKTEVSITTDNWGSEVSFTNSKTTKTTWTTSSSTPPPDAFIVNHAATTELSVLMPATCSMLGLCHNVNDSVPVAASIPSPSKRMMSMQAPSSYELSLALSIPGVVQTPFSAYVSTLSTKSLRYLTDTNPISSLASISLVEFPTKHEVHVMFEMLSEIKMDILWQVPFVQQSNLPLPYYIASCEFNLDMVLRPALPPPRPPLVCVNSDWREKYLVYIDAACKWLEKADSDFLELHQPWPPPIQVPGNNIMQGPMLGLLFSCFYTNSLLENSGLSSVPAVSVHTLMAARVRAWLKNYLCLDDEQQELSKGASLSPWAVCTQGFNLSSTQPILKIWVVWFMCRGYFLWVQLKIPWTSLALVCLIGDNFAMTRVTTSMQLLFQCFPNGIGVMFTGPLLDHLFLLMNPCHLARKCYQAHMHLLVLSCYKFMILEMWQGMFSTATFALTAEFI